MQHPTRFRASYCLLFVLLLAIPVYPFPLDTAVRQTHQDDVIGYYALHPNSSLLRPSARCPVTLETQSFRYDARPAPSVVTAPSAFSISVPHGSTFAAGSQCVFGGDIMAVPASHPFVTNRAAALRAWAGAGTSSPLPWIRDVIDGFIATLADDDWVLGYDFSERACGAGGIIPSHAVYLWVQPSAPFNLSGFELMPDVKYMLLGFGGRNRHRACVYAAQRVGGQPPFQNGPASDPSINETDAAHSVRPSPAFSTHPLPSGVIVPQYLAPSASPTLPDGDVPSSPLSPPPPPPPQRPPSNAGAVFHDPSSTPEEDNDDERACFPASATLGGTRMKDLSLGDSIPLLNGDKSPIVLFSHHVARGRFEYLNISLADGFTSIVLSARHYVHVSTGQLITAQSVLPGAHALIRADGVAVTVKSVRTVLEEGRYAPHTGHGDLVVNGVLVSAYTAAVHPWLSHHVLLAPARVLSKLGLARHVQRVVDAVAQRLAPLAPKGPESIRAFT